MRNEMQIIEHNGVRVATTKQIAEAYGCDSKNLTNNFRRNKSRFVEAKHYFNITGEDLKYYRASKRCPVKSNARNLYLWTERGALLLAKSINTDTAWDAYERLVDFYFEAKIEEKPEAEAVEVVEAEPELPQLQPKYAWQVSQIQIPKQRNWYDRNYLRMSAIARKYGVTKNNIYHLILVRIQQEYDLDYANELYRKETGHSPRYALDLLTHFACLGALGDEIIKQLEG